MRTRTKAEREEMRNRLFNHPSSERQREEARATHDSALDRLSRAQADARGRLGERHRAESVALMRKQDEGRAREIAGGKHQAPEEYERERRLLAERQAHERRVMDEQHEYERHRVRESR